MLDVPVLRTEEYVEGMPIRIYAEAKVPMSEESIEAMSGEDLGYYLEGDTWVVQWWEGYGQEPVVDVYVAYEADTDDANEMSDGFGVANPTSMEEFHAIVAALTKGQYEWLLKTMGDE